MINTEKTPDTHTSTPALIEHIMTRYHETHRRELPALIELARKVEKVHAEDPNTPHGLTQALSALLVNLESHMRKEEISIFAGTRDESSEPSLTLTSELRHDHTDQEAILNKIAAITHGFRLPTYACSSWAKLYAGVGKLIEDLDEHMFLENKVLFPRFERNK